MKKKHQYFVARLLVVMLMISMAPVSFLKALTVQAADSATGTFMKYESNFSKMDSSRTYDGSYNLWGMISGQPIQTTYNNEGFRINLKAEGQDYKVGQIANEVEKLFGNIGVTLNLSFVNGGRYVKVQYQLRNTTGTNQVISLASGADVQIGSDDNAPITKFDDGSGFYMTDNVNQFNFIGKNAFGVTDVDTFWFGNYGQINNNFYSQISTNTLTGVDSGMAYSWKDRTIPANGTLNLSVLIGIGAVNKAPVLNILNPTSSFGTGIPGAVLSFSGNVSDVENSLGTEIYYAIDGGQAIKAYTFSGTPGAFSSSIRLPENILPGDHRVDFYAQDSGGGVSTVTSRMVHINELIVDHTPPTINVLGNKTEWTNGNIVLTIEATDDTGLDPNGAYSFDNGSTWTTLKSKEFSANGTYNLKVRDSAGNVSEKSVIVNRIDKLAPSFSNITQSPTGWTENGVSLTINGASDNEGSGLNSSAYSFSISEGEYNWQESNISRIFDVNQTIYVYVRDALGNISNPSIVNINNIDSTLPNTPAIINADGFTSDKWYNSSQTIRAQFSPTAGSAEYLQYSLNGENWTNGNLVDAINQGGNIVKFRVVDELGRTSGEASCVVQIDNTNPVVISNDENYSWRNNDFSVSLAYDDEGGSQIKLMQYALTNSVDLPSKWINSNNPQVINISQEGQWYIHYKTTDFAGNLNTGYYGPYKLDKSLPTGSAVIQVDKISDGIKSTKVQAVAMNLSANDNLSEVAQVRFSNSEDNLDSIQWEGYSALKNNFLLTDGNGLKTIYFQLKDNAGNISSVYSDSVYFDDNKPTISISQPSKGVIKAGDVVTYTITAEDNSKDFGNIEMAKNRGIETFTLSTDNVEINATNSIDTSKIVKTLEDVPNEPYRKILRLQFQEDITGDGVISLKINPSVAEDSAGNLSDSITIESAVKIDNSSPIILSIDGNPSDWTMEDATLKISAGDTVSELAEKPYSFDGGQTWQESNTKIYTENTSDIIIKVKDAAGNITTYDSISINKIDKVAPNAPIIENKDKYGDSKWFAESQIITSSFTHSEGSDERLQFQVDNGQWMDGEVVGLSTEGQHVVNFRVIDYVGNTSEIETVTVNLDKSLPQNSKITVNEKSFTSFLNKITFGLFFKDTVNIDITSEDNESGISQVEYQKVANADNFNLSGNWVKGMSFSVTPDEKFVVYAKITDNAGNYVIINTDGIIVDATKPTISIVSQTNDWSTDNVKVEIEVVDGLSKIKGLTYTTDETVPQSGSVEVINGKGVITLRNEGSYKLIITASDNSLNETREVIDVKIDKTSPIVSSVTGNPDNWTRENVTLTVNASDLVSKLADKPFSFDGGSTWQESNAKSYNENTSNIVIKVKDAAGNITTYDSIGITKIDRVSPIIMGADEAASYYIGRRINLIDNYGEIYTATYQRGSEQKVLFKDGELLDKPGKYILSVVDKAGNKATLSFDIKPLPSLEEILYKNDSKLLVEEIRKEFNNNKDLLEPYKTIMDNKIKELENRHSELHKQVTDAKNETKNIETEVYNLPDSIDGLISFEERIREELNDISKLTIEQQNNLKEQVDILNGLLNKIETLKNQVEEIRKMIASLPEPEKITKQDYAKVTNIYDLYSKLTNEQKNLLGLDSVRLLNEAVEALKKLMLHDTNSDISVTGIDGTTFDSDIYLVVTPIKGENNDEKLTTASQYVKVASNNIPEIKGKELVALYDISLFKDQIKVQPGGKVKVKIRIPDELKGFSGLDIIHIADDGKVNPMNASVEGEYLVFITDHFSEYGIIAYPTEKALPQSGELLGSMNMIIGGLVLCLCGLGFITIQTKKRKTTRNS